LRPRSDWGRFVEVFWLLLKILGIDQSLAKPPWRWLGTIAPAPDRLVGTFPFPPAFPIPFAWSFAPPVSGPFRRMWRWRLARCVARFDRGGATAVIAATAAPAAGVAFALVAPVSRPWLELEWLAGMALEVLRLDIRNVEKAVASDGEIDESGLNRRLEVDNSALIDVTRVTLVAGSFYIQLFEGAILDDRDAAFLGLEHIDQHFFLHAGSFRCFRRRKGAGLQSLRIVSLSGLFWNGRAPYRSLCSVRPVVNT